MYTYIVFESCSISLCKYKCITFQISQHMLIAILNNKKTLRTIIQYRNSVIKPTVNNKWRA